MRRAVRRFHLTEILFPLNINEHYSPAHLSDSVSRGRKDNKQVLNFSQIFPMNGGQIESPRISDGIVNEILRVVRRIELIATEPLLFRAIKRF
jgi:hypothetical protein